MQAAVGDQLHVHANMVGQPERTGEIVEVRGSGRGAALPGAIRRRSHRAGVPRGGRHHRPSAQEGHEGVGERLAGAFPEAGHARERA